MITDTINNDKTVAGGNGTMLAGHMSSQRPDNVFRSANDIAFALVSELTGVLFEEVKFGKGYITNGIGGFYEVSASSRKNMTTVDISGWYEIDRTKYQNDYILKNGSVDFLIQIHCEAFQNGYTLLAKDKADFIDIYEKSIMLIDSCGLVERLALDKIMYFNAIETQGTPLERNTLFRAYSYSWHEAAKIALSEKQPNEKWKDFVETVRRFCNLLDTGFKRFGLLENKTWQESVRFALIGHNHENDDKGQAAHSKNHRKENAMKCRNCGKDMPMGSAYCSACGKKLENTYVAPVPKVKSADVSDASACELCGVKAATKEVKFDMYIIDDSHYVLLSGRSFRYRSKKEKVQLCGACYSSLTRYDCILAIIALTAWIGLFSFLASFGVNGVPQFIMIGVLSFLLIGFPLAPLIFIFSSERRTGRKVKRIKNMLKKGWKFGKKPTKVDLFSP